MSPAELNPHDPGRSDVEAEVCVVGGGPTALYAALRCARAGRSVVLLSAKAEFEPAGTGISPLVAPPTLALLAAEGVEAELEEGGQRVLGVEDHGSTGVLSAWRYADHDGIDRPHGLTVPTGTLTQALLARLRAEPTADVRAGETVTAVEQDDHGVTATGTGARIRARYLIAADGRRSAVRDLVGIPVTESTFDRPAWLSVVPAVPDREPVLVVRHQAPRALFAIPTPRRTVAVVWSPDRDGEEPLDRGGSAVLAEQVKAVDPELSDWLSEVADRTSPPVRLGFSLWRAASWRAGRVLLLGETANGFHTLGGQGLNQSLQSAASSARAVDDALRPGGIARIDDYERVRRPYVELLQDTQWQVQALRSYSTAPPERGAHQDFIGVMTRLQPELAEQLARPA
ncbi:NAD(P)/FAD-dependent oxidoreductase [Actinosynnema sp. NPDC047251]|uniref:Oxygenase n=1 Tax=Saccharothrix espanaensis (strain ATCC 51144 / DSM 44229 / JCM 9112 / NBRC 15066 / NRRL 15764) TaxID=1179773 RepID=K0JQ66_SACES|nr:NAD(P)/FAD-dependent oxidoreductase [Saccharothrix espanaensis]CCH29440.1 Oxygenase [Saccharothrix espanaensis DSM 44229]